MSLGQNGKLTPEDYKQMQDNTEAYRKTLENVSAERIAIDKQYVKKLQEALQLETDNVKKDQEIQKLKTEIESLKSEVSSLKAKQVEKEIAELVPESVC